MRFRCLIVPSAFGPILSPWAPWPRGVRIEGGGIDGARWRREIGDIKCIKAVGKRRGWAGRGGDSRSARRTSSASPCGVASTPARRGTARSSTVVDGPAWDTSCGRVRQTSRPTPSKKQLELVDCFVVSFVYVKISFSTNHLIARAKCHHLRDLSGLGADLFVFRPRGPGRALIGRRRPRRVAGMAATRGEGAAGRGAPSVWIGGNQKWNGKNGRLGLAGPAGPLLPWRAEPMRAGSSSRRRIGFGRGLGPGAPHALPALPSRKG